jgi:TetR/AcrR family transcriptional regulator, cholesterol catabolism regulator
MDDYRLTARDRQKLHTRARVVDAARDLFAEKGFEQATIREIAARAGVAPGSVFTTFETKADLLQEIVFSRYMTLGEALSVQPHGEVDPVGQLVAFARVAYGFELKEPRLLAETLGASWTWTVQAEMDNRRHLAPLLGVITRLLGRAQAHGLVPEEADIALLSDMVFALYLRNFRMALFEGADAPALADRFETQLRFLLRSS